MSENQSSRIPFGRILIEGAAIVVSILLAFAIDAAWQESQERGEEHRLLVALLDEFEGNRSMLEDGRRHHSAVEQTEIELLELAAQPVPDITLDSLDILISEINWWWAPTKFSTGALNSVVLGGKLQLIKNEVLRRELAGWMGEIERVHFDERQDYVTFHEDFMPFLREHTYVPQLSSVTTHRPGSTDSIPNLAVPMADERVDHRGLLRNRDFQNLLVQRWWVQWDAFDAYTAFEERLDVVVDLLKEELLRWE